MPTLEEVSRGILSYFGYVQNCFANEVSLTLYLVYAQEVIINHKGTRRIKAGED